MDRNILVSAGIAILACVSNGAWDDALRAYERKVGVSGADAWAGIPRHPAVLCRDNSEHMLRNFYAGSCWYRKVVKIPADWSGSRLWLKVGGVRSRGWFYVNGHAVALF